jgi:hypothetical protein
MTEATTYFWERFSDDDSDWRPVRSIEEDLETAVSTYVAGLNASYHEGRPLPARVLAVEVGGNRQAAAEFTPTFTGVRLEQA